MKKIIFLLVLVAGISFFSFCAPQTFAANASLSISPSSRSLDVGETFSVSVFASSLSESMNAAAGVISFPTDKLQLVSLSKTGSIFSLWAQEPSYSNSAGTASFEGVVLNPGFTGSNGKILTLTFKAKAAGSATIRFSSGSILANDGEGTNILSSMGSGQYTIGNIGPVAPESSTQEEVVNTPGAPLVSSETHPNPNEWYAKKTANFKWSGADKATGVRTLVTQQSRSLPTDFSSTPISSKEYTGLGDGVWYFHVQLRNADGWGAVSHFRFQIDTQKPDNFDIKYVESDEPTNPRAKFSVSAKDNLSGIDRYEFQIDNNTPVIWRDDGGHIYETPALSGGRHVLIAKVFDKAGNFVTASLDFSIETIPAPVIVSYNQEMHTGEPIVVRGTAKPNARIRAEVQKDKDEPEKETTRADENGKFTFVYSKETEGGVYAVKFQAIDDRGAESAMTEPISIYVEASKFVALGSKFLGYIAFAIIAIACLLLLVAFLSVLVRRFLALRRDVKKVVTGVEETLHEHFDELREDVHGALRILEHAGSRRELTEDEEKLQRHLAKSLDNAERAIRKELKNFEKKIK